MAILFTNHAGIERIAQKENIAQRYQNHEYFHHPQQIN
jgi:hypothetical protein